MLSERANLTVWLHGSLPVRAEMSDCGVTSAVTLWVDRHGLFDQIRTIV